MQAKAFLNEMHLVIVVECDPHNFGTIITLKSRQNTKEEVEL